MGTGSEREYRRRVFGTGSSSNVAIMPYGRAVEVLLLSSISSARSRGAKEGTLL